LVSCSRDETVRVWDKKSGYCLNIIKGDHDDWIRCCDSDNSYLITSGNSRKLISYWVSDLGQNEGDFKEINFV
jgi:platelet-activating factor acetylhydrolase IB subunit alpha